MSMPRPQDPKTPISSTRRSQSPAKSADQTSSAKNGESAAGQALSFVLTSAVEEKLWLPRMAPENGRSKCYTWVQSSVVISATTRSALQPSPKLAKTPSRFRYHPASHAGDFSTKANQRSGQFRPLRTGRNTTAWELK